MSVVLSQGAGFEDRPVGGGVGLEVSCASGLDGAYLAMDAPVSGGVVHVRVMVDATGLSGGRVVFLRGLDGAGDELVRWVVDGVGQSVEVEIDGAVMSAVLDGAGAWRCVEVGIDSTGGAATLWVDGVERDSALIGAVTAERYEIGGVLKDTGATGVLSLDEWVVGEGYVGPVLVESSGAHGDEASRWVVLYNRGVADSVAWAGDYRGKRGVPYANLIGLEVSSDEVIDAAAWGALRNAVEDYLVLNGLSGRVMGVLVGHGVPGRWDRSDGSEGSVATGLQLVDGGDVAVANPVGVVSGAVRPTVGLLGGARMAARIDGPSVDDSVGLVDRGLAVESVGLGDGSDAKLWLDAVTVGSTYQWLMDEMTMWAEGLGGASTRLPIERTVATEPASEVSFGAISEDGFFWGLREASVGAGFFGEPGGRRVFSAQLENVAVTGETLRDWAGVSGLAVRWARVTRRRWGAAGV